MPKSNRKCLNCGKEYYACRSCVGSNSWKNAYCSIQCYLEAQKIGKGLNPIIINEGGKNMVLLRAGLKNKKTIDIVGYDLEQGKFDCSNGETKTFDDFAYFIVPVKEMQHFTLKPVEPVVEPVKEPKKKAPKAEVEKVVESEVEAKEE